MTTQPESEGMTEGNREIAEKIVHPWIYKEWPSATAFARAAEEAITAALDALAREKDAYWGEIAAKHKSWIASLQDQLAEKDLLLQKALGEKLDLRFEFLEKEREYRKEAERLKAEVSLHKGIAAEYLEKLKQAQGLVAQQAEMISAERSERKRVEERLEVALKFLSDYMKDTRGWILFRIDQEIAHPKAKEGESK